MNSARPDLAWLGARIAAARTLSHALGRHLINDVNVTGWEPTEFGWPLLFQVERVLVKALEDAGPPLANVWTLEAAWIRARLDAALDVLGVDQAQALERARESADARGPWGELLAIEGIATERLGIGVRT